MKRTWLRLLLLALVLGQTALIQMLLHRNAKLIATVKQLEDIPVAVYICPEADDTTEPTAGDTPL